ncbi:hypothetical protein HQ40_04835 [Porphyromonas gulae]|uniref:Uncharacterized protein n=1 Tax=Porphyromonas gulae TaxID=111105 RepID=A0A0A2EF50_9PORP|nr:hypothetical protein HR09_07795 [Porphyromonas gulae]KGN76110.1 hypothetical protein HQ40_04835 [Porphyromonas gulae]KGN84231.1 hypothetical protein HR08_09355 [Porphyromonas gulae]
MIFESVVAIIVDVFCIVDDFSKLFDERVKEKALEEEDKKVMRVCRKSNFRTPSLFWIKIRQVRKTTYLL